MIAKEADWHLKSIQLCKVREEMGGVPAKDSSLLSNSIEGLLSLGWTEKAITEAVTKEFNP